MQNTPHLPHWPTQSFQLFRTLLLIPITVAIIYAGWTFHQATGNVVSDIPPAGPKAALPEYNLTNLLATALHHGNTPDLQKSITLTSTNNSRFQQNFANIAAHQGWLIHHSNSRRISIVIPAADAHQLEALTLDPVAWTVNNLQQQAKRTNPLDNPELINVLITIEKTWGRSDYLMIITVFVFTAAFLTAALAATTLTFFLKESVRKLRARNPADSQSAPPRQHD